MPLPRLELPRCWATEISGGQPAPFYTAFPHRIPSRPRRFPLTINLSLGRVDDDDEEDFTEWVYLRLIWLCSALTVLTFCCAALFCIQLIRTPAEIGAQMKMNVQRCELSIVQLQGNFSQIRAAIHRPSSSSASSKVVVRRKTRRLTSLMSTGQQQSVPIWNADGTFCCIPGPQGPPGKNGVPGHQGQYGAIGEKGKLGHLNTIMSPDICGGKKLPAEKTGDHCSDSCIPGKPGLPGPKGPKGGSGPPGVPGESGYAGLIGICGSKGARGPQGMPGKLGPRGEEGMNQPQRGDPGQAGQPGKLGPRGPRGMPGATILGDKGPSGHRGKSGSPGGTGLTGPSGPAGHPGTPGICPRECDHWSVNMPMEEDGKAPELVNVGGQQKSTSSNDEEQERQQLAEFTEYEQQKTVNWGEDQQESEQERGAEQMEMARSETNADEFFVPK